MKEEIKEQVAINIKAMCCRSNLTTIRDNQGLTHKGKVLRLQTKSELLIKGEKNTTFRYVLSQREGNIEVINRNTGTEECSNVVYTAFGLTFKNIENAPD